MSTTTRRIGAHLTDSGVRFTLWSPFSESVEVVVEGKYFPLKKDEYGYFEALVPGINENAKYKFCLHRADGKSELPDPASRYQPDGPHGVSQIVTPDYPWTDALWTGTDLSEMVIYELHVGTFTEAGTFESVEKHLPHLKDLGVTAIEIMPVAQFAGKRNWGYDGVGLFAPQNSYGGKENSPRALKHLINACHEHGISVILDVVYNHLGPEGNYLPQIGPYFQSKYKTPWGDALNFDGEWSDGVRNYFLENARQWLEEYHIDGLRLDAIHAIFDTSAEPFLELLSKLKNSLQKKQKRKLHLIAESETNDSRILQPVEQGGLGLDGQWADDLHHVVHALITGENQGYYADYGDISQLATAFKDGVVFHGEYSPARHRSHGRSYEGIERTRLIVCSQNHDQIGNRRDGSRLIQTAGPQKQKLAAACVFLSSGLPLLFMGEEIAETNAFQYFVDHTDPDLLEAVRQGRKEEFSGFSWEGEVPDPASEKAFENSKLDWERAKGNPMAREFTAYYKRLIEISKWIRREKCQIQVQLLHGNKVLQVRSRSSAGDIEMYFSFSEESHAVPTSLISRNLEIILDSSENNCDRKSAMRSGPLEVLPFSVLVLRGL